MVAPSTSASRAARSTMKEPGPVRRTPRARVEGTSGAEGPPCGVKIRATHRVFPRSSQTRSRAMARTSPPRRRRTGSRSPRTSSNANDHSGSSKAAIETTRTPSHGGMSVSRSGEGTAVPGTGRRGTRLRVERVAREDRVGAAWTRRLGGGLRDRKDVELRCGQRPSDEGRHAARVKPGAERERAEHERDEGRRTHGVG